MGDIENIDWNNIPFLPVSIRFEDFYAEFDVENGEWRKRDRKISEESPEFKRMQEELSNLKIKNDILLDMLTVKDLDLIEAQKLKKELEDMISRSDN